MKTINYITYDSWWDTDRTIIPDLCSSYSVNVFVLNPTDNERKFKSKTLPQGCNLYEFEQPYRDRDIRSVFIGFNIFFHICAFIRKNNSINIFVPGKNPLFLLLMWIFSPVTNTIICTHNFEEHVDRRKSGLNLKRLFYRKFKKFLFYSELQSLKFSEAYSGKQVEFINMPLKDFGVANKERTDNRITFLFFGLIRDYKRLDIFINAANGIAPLKARFIIAGKSDDWNKYEKMIINKDAFDCNISFIRDEEIPNYFYNSDFLVLPYADSTQSGPSLIAINYGLPIIASDLESFRAIVKDGYNGYLFEPNNYVSLQKVFKKITDLPTSAICSLKNNQLQYSEVYKRKCDTLKVINSLAI